MNDLIANNRLLSRIELILLFFLALFGNFPLFIVLYVFITILLIFKTALGTMQRKYKFILGLGYIGVLTAEIIFATITIFSSTNDTVLHFFLRLIGVAVMPLPFLLEKILIDRETQDFYLPSLGNLATISFSTFAANGALINRSLASISRLHQKASRAVVTELFQDIKRQSATRYLNHGTLSFDAELDTILSYNGGANVYPPGLNPEMVQDLHRKHDASVLIYALPATSVQKQEILTQIKKINHDGSAYNLFGLVAKHSLRPNIMFCSQFVYSMLTSVDLNYFDKPKGEVKPTDLIELDYYKKLTFIRELKFN